MSASSTPSCAARSNARLSLVFPPGERPSDDDVRRLAGQRTAGASGFAISPQAEPSAGGLALLAAGMAFELIGLSPHLPAPQPAIAHHFGFRETPAIAAGEAITLAPGDQLRGMEQLLPVMRALAGVAMRLAALHEVMAVAWHPARCAMSPAAFATLIGNWLNGGAFPALGLTALFRDSGGAICSEGLAFFTSQELRIEPLISINTSVDAKIATRLINHLVGIGPIHQAFDFVGPNGEHLSVEPPGDDGFLRVWRSS